MSLVPGLVALALFISAFYARSNSKIGNVGFWSLLAAALVTALLPVILPASRESGGASTGY